MEVLKQLAPFYKRNKESSASQLDDTNFLTSSRTLHLSKSTLNYSDLSSSLSSSMRASLNSNKVLTREEFVKKVDRLFESVPLPPVHNNPTGSYSLITDIPPIVMCDNATADLFEELLYGEQFVDDLINNSLTGILEQFLYMRSEVITNSYVTYLRECHHDIPEFEITPRSVIFSNSKLNLNETYPLSFTITNKSNTQQTISVTPIASFTDIHMLLSLSNTEFVLKKGKSVTLTVSIRFEKSSTKLSKLILLSSQHTRDFINISATSKSMVFGVDPSFLPCCIDNGFRIPIILALLKQKLILLDGLHIKGIFRLSCLATDGEKMIEYINDNGESIKSPNDLPITDANLVTFLIKYFYRSLPVLVLNTIDLDVFKDIKSFDDVKKIMTLVPAYSRCLLEWFVDIMVMVSENSSENGMGDNNCARMLAPNLFTTEDVIEFNSLLPFVISFCEMLIRSKRVK